ncbi:MAG: NAD-dependent epimerase/dehydratase family protein [Frankia sp.]
MRRARRVLVTGAGGFIGGVVTERLSAAGHQVTALVRNPRSAAGLPAGVEPAVADLLDPAELAAAGIGRGFDAVCHLGALTRVRDSRREPVRYFAVNVGGTVNLLEALGRGADRTGVAPIIVFASSCAVYGNGSDTPIPETALPLPNHPYGASKFAAEQVIAHLAETGRVGAVLLRSFNVAGAVATHQDRDPTRLLPAALAAAAGLTDAVDVNGDGSVVREYLHVADLADAYVAAVATGRPGRARVYNVGSGVGVSVNEVLASVERVTGREVPRRIRPPATEPRTLVSDSVRARTELRWSSPRSRIDDIVSDAWEAMRSTRPTTAATTT